MFLIFRFAVQLLCVFPYERVALGDCNRLLSAGYRSNKQTLQASPPHAFALSCVRIVFTAKTDILIR